jgi:hypothetical protein
MAFVKERKKQAADTIAKRKTISRKGAKTQRRRRQEQAALNRLAFLLCAFAPLRELLFLPYL